MSLFALLKCELFEATRGRYHCMKQRWFSSAWFGRAQAPAQCRWGFGARLWFWFIFRKSFIFS